MSTIIMMIAIIIVITDNNDNNINNNSDNKWGWLGAYDAITHYFFFVKKRKEYRNIKSKFLFFLHFSFGSFQTFHEIKWKK